MLTAQAVADRTAKPLSEIERAIELAKRSLVTANETIPVRESGREEYITVSRNGVGPINTRIGKFHHFDFSLNDKWEKYSVIFAGEIGDNFLPIFRDPSSPLKMRIDSGCETGQMFHDVTCDCRQQLDEAMARIAQAGEGLIINIPAQDARGFSLPYKLATLRLQEDLKVDTLEAGDLLRPDWSKDIRTYAGVVAIMKFLGIECGRLIQLMSNNAEKEVVFAENGYRVTPEELVIEATEHTRRHYEAKQNRLGHRNLIRDDNASST